MAEIPSYDTPQVKEQALPGVRQDGAAGGIFKDVHDDTIRAGASMLSTGNYVAAAAYQMQEKENLEAVQNATTAYGERVLEFKTNAQKTRTLHGAAGLVTDFTDFHKKSLDEIERSLGNAAQRQAFRRMAQRAGLGARQDIAAFEIGETNKAGIITHKANVQTFVNMGATAVTDDTVNEHKAMMLNTVKAFAATRNLDEVSTKIEVDNALAEFHANRIAHLARTDQEGALKYFKSIEREIADPEKRAKIGEFADKAGAEGAGVRVGSEIIAKLGPTDDSKPFELDKMEAAARERFADNPAALKATVAHLRERRSAFEVSRDSRAEAQQGKVNQAVLDGASMGQVRSMPEFLALPGKLQLSIAEHIENRQVRRASMAAANEQRADAAESRRERRLTRDAYPNVLRLMTDPNKLAAMSKDQVLNMLPQIGIQHTENLLQLQEKFKSSSAALSEGNIDKDDFKMVAQGAGFDIEKAKGDDARRLVGLRSQVEREIGMEQQRSGGKLQRERKIEIMQRVLDNAVMVDRTLWPDPKKPVATLTKEERKNAYVVVDDTEVRMSQIPEAAEREIITARRARGLPVNAEDIARTWLRAQKPARKDGLK